MTPEDLNEAVDAVVGAVRVEPVLVVLDGVERPLGRVEARTDGRLVLHANPSPDKTLRVTREFLTRVLVGDLTALDMARDLAYGRGE